jgi:hypothetical protein
VTNRRADHHAQEVAAEANEGAPSAAGIESAVGLRDAGGPAAAP